MDSKKTVWKVLCDKCGSRYEEKAVMPPNICGVCGSDDLLVGRKLEPESTAEESLVYH